MASWVRVPALSLALAPGWRTSAPATRIASAVAVQTNRVSTTTPKAWMNPCWTGWLTVAEPAAQAAPPSPASLENRPRRTPLSSAAVTPPARPPSPWRRPKAPSMMELTASRAWTGWVRRMARTSTR